MSDWKIQGAIEMSSEGTERAFDRVGQKAEQMAQNVERSAKKAGSAADNIGSNAEKSAEGFTRAEGKIVSSIKRATTQLENFGKTASQRLELQIDTRNLDRAKFEPYLAKLRELEAAQDGVKRSASGVPSAFDDIARSLGGVAAAVVGAMSIGQFAGKLVAVQREFDILNSSLVTVTGSSSAAAREFAWIKQFAAETPYGLNQVTEAFVKMKSLGLDASKEALQSYGNTASAMGKDLNQMIEAVADASTGEFERLKEFGIKAKQQGDQVSLTFQGVTKTIGNNAAEITKYLQEIGDNQFGAAMAERAKTLDGAISNLGDSWDELFRTVNQAGVGSVIYESVQLASRGIQGLINNINALRSYWQQTEQQQVDLLVAERSRWQESLSGARPGSFQAVKAKEAIEEINGEIRRLQESFERQQYAATQAADQTAKAMKPAGEAVAGVGREARIAAREAERLSQSGRDLVASLVGQSAGLSADFFKKWETLGQAYKAGAISLQDLTNAQAALLAQQPAMKEAAKDAEDYGRAIASTVGALEDRALVLETELQNYGLTKSQIERTTVARLEEVRAMARANGATEDYLANLDREIAARKRIAEATAGVEAAEANRKAADDAAKEWQRTADAIEDALIDALMEGGKSGKEYIEGLFRTMVLRPVVQAIVQPIAGSLTNAMGFGAPGQGSSGGSFGLPPGLGTTGLISSGIQWAGAALGSSAIGSFGAGMAMTSSQIAGLSGAGLINGTAASLGSTVAAAMPYIGAALFAAQALGLFDKKPSDKSSWASFDPATGRTYDVGSMTGKKDPGQEQRDATAALAMLTGGFAGLAGIDASVTAMIGGRDGTRLRINRDEGTQGFLTPQAGVANGNNSLNYGSGEDAIKKMLDDLVDEGSLPTEVIEQWRTLKTDAQGVARDAVELVSTLDLLTEGYDAATIERANLLQMEGEALEGALARMQSLESALSGTALPGDALAQSVGAIIRQFDELAQAVPLSVESLGSVIDGLDLTTAEGRKTYQSLMALAPAFIEIQNAQKSLYDQLYTDEQRAANLAVEVGDAFAKLGLSMPATRDEMRALIDAQDGTTEAGAKLKAQLLGLVPAFVSVSDAAQQAAQVAIDAARDALKKQFDGVESVLKAEIARFGTEMSGLQSALNRAADAERNRLNAAADAERTAISDQIAALSDVGGAYESATDAIRGASSALRGAIDSLRGIERIDRMQYDQAVAQIDVMTVLARAGVMPDEGKLQSAIGTITSADSSRYASSFEMEREQLRRAAQLETLDSIITSNAAYQDAAAERERAAAESQIDLLKAQLASVDSQLEGDLKRLAMMEASGTAQLNALLGVDDSVVSMDAAMRAIGEATGKYEKDHLKLLERDLETAERHHAQSLSSLAQIVATGAHQSGLLLSVDYNIKQLAAQMSMVGAALVAAAQPDGLPAFASGGMHAGGVRLVGERGPELEVTGPARIWSAEDTRRFLSGGGDAGTADEIRALRQEQQAQARAQVALEARMVKLLERWERDGMPTTRLEPA